MISGGWVKTQHLSKWYQVGESKYNTYQNIRWVSQNTTLIKMMSGGWVKIQHLSKYQVGESKHNTYQNDIRWVSQNTTLIKMISGGWVKTQHSSVVFWLTHLISFWYLIWTWDYFTCCTIWRYGPWCDAVVLRGLSDTCRAGLSSHRNVLFSHVVTQRNVLARLRVAADESRSSDCMRSPANSWFLSSAKRQDAPGAHPSSWSVDIGGVIRSGRGAVPPLLHMHSWSGAVLNWPLHSAGRTYNFGVLNVVVHSIEQKSFGLKFSKSRTGSDVRYSCHHNSSRFTFPIFAHSCRFSVLHSLQSITPRIY